MAGNQGDQGDQGDQGNLASTVAGGGAAFADRVDFPFVSVPGIADTIIARTKFGARNWATQWAAWHTLADFASTPWRTLLDPKVAAPGPVVAADIDRLRQMALDERSDALGEIVSQDREFISYFLQAMGGNADSRPASFLVFCIANLVATLAVMHFKLKFDYPRPSHICPALLPPLPVPGHASYPSGHATQAHLFALCAKEMLPAAQQADFYVVLEALAKRIARNREIAGLHYRKDSKAGKKLAAGIFTILSDDTAMSPAGEPSKFRAAMDAAQLEWA